ncbi:hypothetical protein B0T09DRAFT_387946 [Sordaria sp. MPI-SDFR-AT-0083]|nr:hypothetical protein B0T09DRAFT_387946 [Sordaria sp. MPI-SDFR-AT-0083]
MGQLYSGVNLGPAPSYADFAIRQRKQLESGALTKDLSYWADIFKQPPARLPPLNVPEAKADSTPTAWPEHEVSAHLNRMAGILLARLTGSAEIVIGVADSNRSTLTDQATMGYFTNLLPARLPYDPDKIFHEAKEQMRGALLHGAAVFDYKQGQAESGNIGDAKIVDSRTPRAGSPYDITLEMSDDPHQGALDHGEAAEGEIRASGRRGNHGRVPLDPQHLLEESHAPRGGWKTESRC